jgi:hypothetical protein
MGWPLDREIEPVVILLVDAHPATPAIKATANVVASKRLYVAVFVRVSGMGARPSVRGCGHSNGRLPLVRNILLTLIVG